MKILHVINSMATGGAETLLIQSAPLYLQRGVEIDILLLSDDPNGRDDNFINSNPSIKVHRLSSKNIYSPIHLIKIMSFINKGFDLIHVHLFPSSYWVVLAKLFSFSNVKLIFTEHSTYNRRRGSLFFKLVDRWVYSRFDHIIAISKATEQNLIKHVGRSFKNKISVIENGIDLTRFRNVASYDYGYFDLTSRIIIQVSSFRPQKDQKSLVMSLKWLPDSVKLLLVGDGPGRQSIETFTKELGLTHRVKFLGIRTDIPELMGYADIVVLSSHYEGFGLAIVEGMASKKPSVASNIEGISEIVKGHGLLFEKGNAKELASKLNLLLDNQVFYDSVAQACIERAKQYDINRMVDRYLDLYKNVKHS